MTSSYNIGLGILRTIMCFMVILCHFWNADYSKGIMVIFSYMRGMAVPVFMMMSFVLMYDTLISNKTAKIKARIERLLIPHISWAIIYWIVYVIIDILRGGEDRTVKLSDLFWQVFTGHSPKLNPAMWYQIDVLLVTVFFVLIIKIFNNRATYAIGLSVAISIFLQYSEINLIFSNLRYELKYPLGRIAEMIPLASGGFFVSKYNLLNKYSKQIAIPISVLIIVIVAIVEPFSIISEYGYSGIDKIIVAGALILLFYSIPFDLLPERIVERVKFFLNYTLGIYCMHNLIGRGINSFLLRLGLVKWANTFGECLVIYSICFIFAHIACHFLKRINVKRLFL